MADRHVTIPLMIRSQEELQFVEDDTDTVSENEPSSGVGRNSTCGTDSHVYTEIPPPRERKKGFLDIPKFISRGPSRSTSPENSSAQASPTLDRKNSTRRKGNRDYEKLSVTSNTSKKSTVERIAESTFFRRRVDTSGENKKGDPRTEEEEHVLETLRQVVRKCTTVDPVKIPSSVDILDMLSTTNGKS